MHYEMVPEGLVSRFVPTSAASGTGGTGGSGGGTGGAVTSVENVAVADDVTAERFVNNTHSGIMFLFLFLFFSLQFAKKWIHFLCRIVKIKCFLFAQ